MESTEIPQLENIIEKVTFNVDHTIQLLKNEDNAILEQALTSLLDYSEESPKNASALFKKDVISIFINLLKEVEAENSILMLKIILRIMKNVPECLDHIFATNSLVLCHINDLFLMTDNKMLQQLSADLLSNASRNVQATNKLVKTNAVSTIFARLQTGDDFALKLSLLHYLETLLMANYAKVIFIDDRNLPLEVLFRCTTMPMYNIQNTVFDILDTLISWKSYAVEILLCRASVIENMLKYIMNDDHELFHDRAFNIIYEYCESSVTISYFIDSQEFINFCKWSKTCEDKHVLFSASFMTLITKSGVTREKLIRDSIHDTVLSYIRCNDPPTFYKNCQMFCNLLRSAHCPLTVVNDDVICYMLEMLQRIDLDSELLLYFEMALKSLAFFLVWRSKSLSIFIRNDGINIFHKALKNWNQVTNDGLISFMKLIEVLCTSETCTYTLNRNLYEKIIQCFSKPSLEVSKHALQILMHIYLKDVNFNKYFFECNGPNILVNKLQHIDNDDFYRTMLSFVHKLIPIADLGKHLLLQTDIFRILNSFASLIFHKFFKLRRVLFLLCELHRELKFYKYGFLPPEIVCDNGFYVIKDTRGFCFIENMLDNCTSPLYTMYVVNSVGPPVIVVKENQDIEEEPSEITSVASTHTACRSCGFLTNLETGILCSLCGEKIDEAPSADFHIRLSTPLKSEYLRHINYGTLSPDPFLTKHIEKLTDELSNAEWTIKWKVQRLAQYVAATIREPLSIHAFMDYILQLKGILGTSMIPIGYLRFGYACERALLFKVLADKLNFVASLNKGRSRKTMEDFMYWNEITIECDQKYIVDLMGNVGDLIEVGHPEADDYCKMIKK